MIRVSKAVNPQRRKRKLSVKQIRIFGTKRQKAALKAKRRPTSSHKHRSAASASNPKRKASVKRKRASAKRRNPVTKVVYRTKYKTRTRKVYVEKPRRKVKAKANRKRRSKKNPFLMTLSPVMSNPHKKRKRRNKTVAKPKRRVSAKRSAKRKNPTRRRSVKRSSHRPRGSRNPFGHSTMDIGKLGFGVIVGVTGSKLIPRNYPASMTGTPTMSIVSTALTAGVLAWLANRFARGPIALGVLAGGAAQVINVAVNAFAPPSVSQYGLGDFVPGGFPLPQGPVRLPIAAAPMQTPSGSQVNVGAFGTAW